MVYKRLKHMPSGSSKVEGYFDLSKPEHLRWSEALQQEDIACAAAVDHLQQHGPGAEFRRLVVAMQGASLNIEKLSPR